MALGRHQHPRSRGGWFSPSRQSMEARKGRDPQGLGRSEAETTARSRPAWAGRRPHPAAHRCALANPQHRHQPQEFVLAPAMALCFSRDSPAMPVVAITMASVGVVTTVSEGEHFPDEAALAIPFRQMKTPTLAGRGSDRRSGSHRPTHHSTVASPRQRFKAVNLRLQTRQHIGSAPLGSRCESGDTRPEQSPCCANPSRISGTKTAACG